MSGVVNNDMKLFFLDNDVKLVTLIYLSKENEDDVVVKYEFSFEEFIKLSKQYSEDKVFFKKLIDIGYYVIIKKDEAEYEGQLQKFLSGKHDFEGFSKKTKESILTKINKNDLLQYKLVTAKREEMKYTLLQDERLSIKTGCICHMRVDFGPSGTNFLSLYDDHNILLAKMDGFKDEFNRVIESLRFDETHNNFLNNRKSLLAYCKSNPQAQFPDDKNRYGFRLDVGVYTYMICCKPYSGEYDFSCIVYDKYRLDTHIHNSRKGIRFIDSEKKELFTITDGETVRLTTSDGDYEDAICRYLDDFQVRIGDKYFYIKEFVKELEVMNVSIEPVRKSLSEKIKAAEGMRNPNKKEEKPIKSAGKKFFYKLSDVSEIKAKFLQEEGFKCLHKVKLYTEEEFISFPDKKMLWPVQNPDDKSEKRFVFRDMADAYKALIKTEQNNRTL